MKNSILLALIWCLSTHLLFGQYKFDHTLYQTVYLEDLCSELDKSPDRLLLDVRSPGEYSDTSSRVGLNIGRLKGSVNISITELGKRLNELEKYKSQPVFIYCSHSQRSRKAAKMLADSGFVHPINVNGGMTEFNLIKNSSNCLNDLYQTANHFNLLSPKDVYQLVRSDKEVFMLDIRTDSIFNGISKEAAFNAFGRIKGAVNIPFSELAASLSKIPHDKTILIIDNDGDDSMKAAELLYKNGYSDINMLFNGMEMWVSEKEKNMPKKEKIWVHPDDFGFVTAEEFDAKMHKKPLPLILDIRTVAEFTNQDTVLFYRNRGHIQNALNIPLSELSTRMTEIATFKNKDIIVYAFSNSPEAFTAAKLLSDNGFDKVKVLTGGLWDIRWKAANIKGLSHLMQWVVDVPEGNL